MTGRNTNSILPEENLRRTPGFYKPGCIKRCVLFAHASVRTESPPPSPSSDDRAGRSHYPADCVSKRLVLSASRDFDLLAQIRSFSGAPLLFPRYGEFEFKPFQRDGSHNGPAKDDARRTA